MKKAGSCEPAFLLLEERYFFISSGLVSVGEDGVGADGAPGGAASGFGASGAGVGAGGGGGVVAGALGAGAGGGAGFSSFLPQAVRPTATRAAKRSERFILFSFRRSNVRLTEERTGRLKVRCLICSRLSVRHEHFTSSLCDKLTSTLQERNGSYSPSTLAPTAGVEASQSSPKRSSNCCAPSSSLSPLAQRIWS